jgi:hypothetical protein
MAKKRGRKKDPPPLVVNDILTIWDYDLDQPIDQFHIGQARNWTYWQAFLDRKKAFRYECEGGAFTAVKEIRRGSKKAPRAEKAVWYAHRRIKTKLYRKYLGYAESLTTDKLWQAAFDLSQLAQKMTSEFDNSV